MVTHNFASLLKRFRIPILLRCIASRGGLRLIIWRSKAVPTARGFFIHHHRDKSKRNLDPKLQPPTRPKPNPKPLLEMHLRLTLFIAALIGVIGSTQAARKPRFLLVNSLLLTLHRL
jgi:hypothetical protein